MAFPVAIATVMLTETRKGEEDQLECSQCFTLKATCDVGLVQKSLLTRDDHDSVEYLLVCHTCRKKAKFWP